jgi:hypothetical protein
LIGIDLGGWRLLQQFAHVEDQLLGTLDRQQTLAQFIERQFNRIAAVVLRMRSEAGVDFVKRGDGFIDMTVKLS